MMNLLTRRSVWASSSVKTDCNTQYESSYASRLIQLEDDKHGEGEGEEEGQGEGEGEEEQEGSDEIEQMQLKKAEVPAPVAPQHHVKNGEISEPISEASFSLRIPLKKFKEVTVISRYNDLLFFIAEEQETQRQIHCFVLDLRTLHHNMSPTINETFMMSLAYNSNTSLGHLKACFGKLFMTTFSKQEGVVVNVYTLNESFVAIGSPQRVLLKKLTVSKAPMNMQIFDFSDIYVMKLMSMEIFSQGELVISGRCRKHDNAQYFGYLKWHKRRNEFEFHDIRLIPYSDILSEMNHPRITYLEHKKIPFFIMYWSSTCYKLGVFWREKILILNKKCKILNCPTQMPYNGGLQRDALSIQPLTNKFLISMTTGRYSLPKTVVSVFQIELNF
jgi:hypothetical protein